MLKLLEVLESIVFLWDCNEPGNAMRDYHAQAKKEIEAAQHEREKLLKVLEDAARVLEWGEPQPKPVLGRVQEILSKAKDEKPSTLVDTNDMVELVINGNLVDVFPNEQDCKAYLKDKYGDSLPPSIVAIAILPFGKMVPFNRRP